MCNFKHLTKQIQIYSLGRGRGREHQEGGLEGEARQHAGRDQRGQEDPAALRQEGHRSPDRRQMSIH